MENHRQILFLLLFLKRMGVKFDMSHGYIHNPIQVLGKFEPVDFIIDNIYITTEEPNGQV